MIHDSDRLRGLLCIVLTERSVSPALYISPYSRYLTLTSLESIDLLCQTDKLSHRAMTHPTILAISECSDHFDFLRRT